MKTLCKAIATGGTCAAALWMLPVIADDTRGVRPGDEAMTCAQIGAELAPYAQQIAPTARPLADTQAELVARNQARMSEYSAAAAAMSAGALASSLDPTGMSSKAAAAAEQTMQQEAWNRSMAEDKPLRERADKQTKALVSKATAMQSDARMQRLMALAQQKNCH